MQDQQNPIALPGFLTPEPGRLAGGQPSQAQLEQAAKNGLKWVIDLRPAREDHGFDEPAIAPGQGLTYVSLPIGGPDDLTLANARKLDELLSQAGDASVLVHCASGNRVGALIALRAAWLQDQSTENALARGREWGLTKMQPMVAKLLG